MNKVLKFYGLIWLISLAIFNAIVFLVPRELCGVDRWAEGGFWVGYALSTVSFLAHLLTGVLCLRHNDPNKVFLRLSLPLTASVTLIASLVAGCIFMLIPTVPAWIGSIISLVFLLLFVVAVLKAQIAISLVSAVDTKIARQTSFMRTATGHANNILQAAGDSTRDVAKKVWEALRYSDPMSHDRLATVEGHIAAALNELEQAVRAGDANAAGETAEQLLCLIRQRNNDCKMLKSVR